MQATMMTARQMNAHIARGKTVYLVTPVGTRYRVTHARMVRGESRVRELTTGEYLAIGWSDKLIVI